MEAEPEPSAGTRSGRRRARGCCNPGGGALDDPAHASERVLVLDPAPGDAHLDPALVQVGAAATEVVALVRMQLRRASSWPAGSSTSASHRRVRSRAAARTPCCSSSTRRCRWSHAPASALPATCARRCVRSRGPAAGAGHARASGPQAEQDALHVDLTGETRRLTTRPSAHPGVAVGPHGRRHDDAWLPADHRAAAALRRGPRGASRAATSRTSGGREASAEKDIIHAGGSKATEAVYRKQLRPVVDDGATAMDRSSPASEALVTQPGPEHQEGPVRIPSWGPDQALRGGRYKD